MAEDEAKPTCFIIMPISTPEDRVADYADQKDHFRQVMDALFVPAVAAAGYEAVKPEFKGSAMIQPAIIRHLIDAPLVLCDMSILNPNVFFELGVRAAMNKPVAMVRDHLTPKIPFDVGSVAAHEYDGTLAGWKLDAQRELLAEHLTATASNGTHNELWRYFGIRDVASRPPEGTEMERIEAMLQELRATIRPSVNVTYGSGLYASDADSLFPEKSPLDYALEELSETLTALDIEHGMDAYVRPGTIIIHLPANIPKRDFMLIEVAARQIGERHGLGIDFDSRTT